MDKQSNKEWAKLNDTNLPELERLTVCVWVKLHFKRVHNQVWTYCSMKRFILVCSGLGKKLCPNLTVVTKTLPMVPIHTSLM